MVIKRQDKPFISWLNNYDKREIPFYYLKERFLLIEKNNLVDFLPFIIKEKRNEMAILYNWERHFKLYNIPYCVKEERKFWNTGFFQVITLWKERKS